MADVKKRTYHSPLRTGQAEASRAAVLRAAHELFVDQGYGATTIAQVATLAGVSKPTVFAAVGNKATLLKVVRDVAMAGDDDPRTVTERADVAAIARAGDLGRAVELTAAHIAAVNARYHDVHEVIRGASGTDPVVAELWETAEAERHVGAGHLLARLHAAPALPPQHAQDRLWLLMAPDNYHRLVAQRGWTRSAYQRWLTAEIGALLDA
ncbi:helix-turn-helix domain-containing protein [Nocardioides sp. LHD-245]|uniref:TetR/AcrR family transcriptional regulator n=1 Tax=Nocardioides sp. LHD-245 TaxID=3051387 RepID=UPI0027DF7777|nr:helix-turn-helix domain-containing protein [Nocardioides sp. LHD-245]